MHVQMNELSDEVPSCNKFQFLQFQKMRNQNKCAGEQLSISNGTWIHPEETESEGKHPEPFLPIAVEPLAAGVD